jgi:hypothetical protein
MKTRLGIAFSNSLAHEMGEGRGEVRSGHVIPATRGGLKEGNGNFFTHAIIIQPEDSEDANYRCRYAHR